MKRYLISVAWILCGLAMLAAGGTYGANLYYAAGHGSHCADCHEMRGNVSEIHASLHHNAGCADCHEASLATKLRHIRVHLTGSAPESIRLRDVDVQPMIASCQRCHQHEYASWHAGQHSATFSDIFTNTTHNTKRRLMDDCFRCHGMYFDGAICDLVQPIDTHGPWRLTHPEMSTQAVIPCQACHWIHHDGTPQGHPSIAPETLALYDRREQMHFTASAMAVPVLYDGAQQLKISPDPRQSICYQCHAPRAPEAGSTAAVNHWGPQAGSGDDRTPMGVHEGLSCFACHNGHDENARASCANCHPKMSNCGQNVEKMDTTFANRASRHNIHWVKCVDCHEHGVPRKKTPNEANNAVVQGLHPS